MRSARGMRSSLLWLGVACLLAACYERMPRRGPLAAIADSLFPSGEPLTCLDNPPFPWEDAPRVRTCFNPADTSDPRAVLLGSSAQADHFMVGSTGWIYLVTKTWPGDSLGQLRAAAERDILSAELGPPVHDGTDQHGDGSTRWRGDGFCVSLHEGRRPPPFYQLGRSTVGLFLECR
jgi:hypothetical protein